MDVPPVAPDSYIVYKITCNHCQKVYIGSTKSTLKSRFERHKRDALQDSKLKIHRHMKIINIRRFTITQIGDVTFSTRAEARGCENFWIKELNTVSNGFNGKFESQICYHDIRRKFCTPCGGSMSKCVEHGRIRYQCNKPPCSASATNICNHNKQKHQCSICKGKRCHWCEKVYGVTSYETHMRSTKHENALIPNLKFLFGNEA